MNTRPEGFTAFHWTSETAFFGYTLRDANGNARAVITHTTKPEYGAGWHGQIFTSGMPGFGPVDSADDAAWWVVETMQALELVAKDSRFGPLPEVT